MNNSELENPPYEDVQKLPIITSHENSKRSFRQSELEGQGKVDQPENSYPGNFQAQGSNYNSEVAGYNDNKNTYAESQTAERDVRIDVKIYDTPLNLGPSQQIQQDGLGNYQSASTNPTYQNQQPQTGPTPYDHNIQHQPDAYDNQQLQANPMVDPNAPVNVDDITPVMTEKPKTEDEALIQAQKCNWHIACLFFNCVLWIFVIICIALRDQSIIWAWLILGGAIFGYYQDCKNSATGEYLRNNFDPKGAGKELERILTANSGIKFHIVCYHFVTKTRKVRRHNRYYDESYQEKVTTHQASSQLNFQECIDTTGKIDFDASYVTRLHLLKEHNFVDKRSENLYKRQKVDFFNANKKDSHNDFSEIFFIENFNDNLLVVPPGAELPLLFNHTSYTIFSAIGLSWFYRMWFDMKTAGKVLTIKKTFRVELQN